MDGSRFDRLAKALTAVGSRRQALGGLLVASLALLGGPAPEEATAKPRHTDRKDRKKDRTKERRRDARGCLSARRDLQEKIRAAQPGATVVLCPGTWGLKKTVNITKDLTLIGAGADQSILAGRKGVGVLSIAAGATVTAQNLTITKGGGGAGGSDFFGGGIRNEGTLTLVDVNVTDNAGGIDNGGILRLVRISVTGNTSEGSGGGIYNGLAFHKGIVTLEDGSSVSGNHGYSGGGIWNGYGAVTLKAGSSVSGNSAQTYGGGIANSDSVTLEAGSSVMGNTAGTTGGGIDNYGSVTLLAGSSVTGNSASTTGGGILVSGGMVSVADSTVVVNNTPNNCAGTVVETCIGCAPDHTECGGECIDTLTNDEHCGGCSQVCDPMASCVNGVCLA